MGQCDALHGVEYSGFIIAESFSSLVKDEKSSCREIKPVFPISILTSTRITTTMITKNMTKRFAQIRARLVKPAAGIDVLQAYVQLNVSISKNNDAINVLKAALFFLVLT